MLKLPRILTGALPENERIAGNQVTDNLSTLSECVKKFAAANELMNFCDEKLSEPQGHGSQSLEEMNARLEHNSKLLQWEFIAAESGAMTIYSFYQTRQSNSGMSRQCPSLFKYVDNALLGKANRLFDNSFKDFADLRHNAAHMEWQAKPDMMAKVYADVPLIADNGMMIASGLTVATGLIGRRYTIAREGRYLSYDLNQETVDKLELVASLIFAAFEPVEAALRTLLIAHSRKNRER